MKKIKKILILPFFFLTFNLAYSMKGKEKEDINKDINTDIDICELKAYHQLPQEDKIKINKVKIAVLTNRLNSKYSESDIKNNIEFIKIKIEDPNIQVNQINKANEMFGILSYIFFKYEEKKEERKNAKNSNILKSNLSESEILLFNLTHSLLQDSRIAIATGTINNENLNSLRPFLINFIRQSLETLEKI